MTGSVRRAGIPNPRFRPLTVMTLLALSVLLLVSPAVQAAGSGPPANTVLPTLKGAAKVGKKLKAKAGDWTGTKTITYSYRWQTCNGLGEACTTVSGATTSTYTPGASQGGDTLRVLVTAKNSRGEASATSLASSPIVSGAKTTQIELCGTISKSETLSPVNASRYLLTCEVTIAPKVKLTIAPGTVIKASSASISGCAYNVSCSILVNGTLDVVGTASEPVTFTSINDNTVGGATGTGSPEPGEWGGIFAGSASSVVDVQHVRMSYAATAVWAGGAGATIRESAFSSMSSGAVAVSNSTSPTVTANTATNVGGRPAFSIDSSDLNLSLLGGNTATGSGKNEFAISGKVGQNSTLPGGALPWAIEESQPAGGGEYNVLEVPEGIQATIAPGAVIKAGAPGESGCAYNVSCSILVNGTLDVVGTASEPVTFTSINDNTVGGATGTGSPEPGEWGGIYLPQDGSLTAEDATLSYAQTAVNFDGRPSRLQDVTIAWSSLGLAAYGEISVRGSLVGDEAGVRACDWGAEGCAVDAAYSYWGSPGGPTPSGKEARACGMVTLDPYETAVGGSTVATTGQTSNCDGSATPWEALETAQTRLNERIGHEENECSAYGEPACKEINETIERTFRCLSGAFETGASQLPFSPANPFTKGAKGAKWQSGASMLRGAAIDWLSKSSIPVLHDVGEVASRASEITGLAQTFVTLARAYESC